MKFKVCFLTSLLALQLSFCGNYVKGAAYFTDNFPKVYYLPLVGNGTATARFVWDYHVDDRMNEFDSLSPKWSFFNGSKEEILIQEDKFDGWRWKISVDCPARFKKRVSKESTATLVISNVTTADNGIYGCTLVLAVPITKKTELIVTVRSQINITGETNVTEYTNLTLICSAVGPPTPNVMWLNDASVVLTQGIQSAVLTIANISREQAGTYKCNATNNPNEHPVQEMITVTVKYPPKLDRSRSDNYAEACPGEEKHIKCAANGYPLPTYYWYNPNNKSVKENKTGVESKILVKAVEGNWTCYITNGIGQGIYHQVQMKVFEESSCKKFKKSTGLTSGEIVGIVIGVIAVVAIIAVIAVIIYKKKSG